MYVEKRLAVYIRSKEQELILTEALAWEDLAQDGQ